MDHRYVKYQSFFNSSWFIGFDRTGTPIPGQYVIKRDGSNRAMRQERCYHFMKLGRLSTTAQVFPEVIPLMQEAANKTATVSSLESFLKEAASMKQNLRQPSALVPLFHQKQLINMTRFRNILRYQLGRSIGQPLVAISSTAATQPQHNKSNSSNVKIGSSSLNKTHSIALDAADVSNRSPRNLIKTTAKRKTLPLTSSSTSARKLDNQAESRQPDRIKSKGTPTEPIFEDSDDSDGEHNHFKMDSDHIHQSKLLSIRDRGSGRRDFAMENFSKFSAPASGA